MLVAAWRRGLFVLTAVLGLIAAVWLVPSAGGAQGEAIRQPGPLVVVGVPSLSWAQVGPRKTPGLWSLVERGAVGALVTRVLAGHSCSPESWLTLSAGFAATYGHPAHRCARTPRRVLSAVSAGRAIPGWHGWRRRMLRSRPPASIGALADVLDARGQCIGASGADAAMGAATSMGVVRHFATSPDALDLTTCPVAFVSLEKYDDAALTELLARLPSNATVVFAGMADDDRPTTLHALVVAGPGVRHGVLTSWSTRQRGLVATADLTALVLERVAKPPVLRIGRAPTVQREGRVASVSRVRDLTEALDVEQPFVPTFFGLFLGGSALLLVVGASRWWWLNGTATAGLRRRHRRVRRWFAFIGAMCACMPAATFLVGIYPWWRSAHPRASLCLGIVVVSSVLTAFALLGPWRRARSGPMTFLVTATFVVIAVDVIRGSALQLVSVMGLQPVYGGRDYGMGNVGAAVWLTASLLMATMFADRLVRARRRRAAISTVVGIGVVTLVIDSAPWWGAKAGAMLAIVPAFSLLAMRTAQLRVTARAVVAIVVVTLATVAGFGLLDYLRPVEQRTHVGTTVADVVDHGDLSGVANIARLNWHLLTSSWLDASVLLLVAAMLVVLVAPAIVTRPLSEVLEDYPLLGAGLLSVALCWLIAFLSEDSGTGIPPTGLLVVVPLLTLLNAHMPDTHARSDVP